MSLPVTPFVAPMLAKAVDSLPLAESAGAYAYEPKWDGFRCLIFRDGESVVITSRDEKDLTYCFPEVEEYAQQFLPPRIVLDGELIIVRDDRLDFEALGSRIRPRSEAGGRSIAALASGAPAEFVAFDLLAFEDRDLTGLPFAQRRELLESALATTQPPVHLTPLTLDPIEAERWFTAFEGAGLDGLIIKPLDQPYSPGKRTMLKLKHVRSADLVVAAWREHKASTDSEPLLGSLVLGAYDDAGLLQHLGVCSSFTMARRSELAEQFRQLEVGEGDDHPWLEPADGTRIPGGVSRWSAGRGLTFRAVRPDVVAEVRYDQLQGDRLRHTAQFLRWRPDREPQSCTFEQFDRPEPLGLSQVLGA